MMPMPHRRLSSVAVRTGGSIYLFDCGEGTQVPYKELHLGLRNLDVVFISHLHADHVLGLPGMLMLRAQMPDPEPLTLVGPPGLSRFVKNVRADLRMHIRYPINYVEWTRDAGDVAFEDGNVRVLWHPLEHSVFCLGFRLEEHIRPGRFDPEAARALGIPPGPLYGQLQAGKTVSLDDGREIRPDQVVGETRRGRHVAFVTDTVPCASMQPLMHKVDIAFVESMFLPEHTEDAADKKHMTCEQSAQAALEAEVDRLVLLHISPRYENRELKRIRKLAQAVHPRAEVGREGQVIQVPLPS
ncbi:MAG: ribonuclease Z [Myxococcales bacterium]|nr:ribonuclease Z [Myxococcales bacterium]